MNGVSLRQLPSHQLSWMSASYYAQATLLHKQAMALPTSLCPEYGVLCAAAQELRELMHEITVILTERTARHD